ncbi:hypothetical protein [Chryseobacterium viscerum]|uniref:Uncharacterized protein n=1 Tax=Chryseobacterium viscerum TaxID=1037377 RepID=A0A316WL63_9FLAO|nr:hypothetical protein [Chryseobacterium viscerum]PWN59908.1 hypothetical protein C1634_017970 [Chryseobacterium viscerum]
MNYNYTFTTLIFLCFLLSCSSKKRPQFVYRNEIKTQGNPDQFFYTKRFRDNVFYKCLQFGYGNSLNIKIGKLMNQKDLFTQYDEPLIKEDSLQNILAKKIIENLPLPYIHVEDKNSIKGKNFIISTCLSYYESRDLNSIAEKMYKEKVKEEKKLWGKDFK